MRMKDWKGYRGVTSGKLTQYGVNLPQYASKSYQYEGLEILYSIV
jgi:hypothetical protein